MASTGTDDTELCLHDIVKEHCFKRYNYRPSLLHRLDRVCSGLMVFGKHKPAEQYYQNLQQGLKGEDSDSLVKGYLAIVKGKPKRSRGTIKVYALSSINNYNDKAYHSLKLLRVELFALYPTPNGFQ